MSVQNPARENSSSLWRFRRHRAALVGSVVIAVGLVWLMRAGALPVVPDLQHLGQARWWTIAAYSLVWVVMLLVRASRWCFLLAPIHPVPWRRAVAVNLIAYGALVILPFRLGEVARPALIRKRGQLSFMAATGTVGAERVIDGLVLSVTLLVALLSSTTVSPLPDHIGQLPIPAAVVPGAAYSACILFAGASVAMAVLYYWRDGARRLTERVVGVVSPRLGARLAEMVIRLADGLRFLPRWRYTGPFLVLTAVYWFIYLCGAWLLIWGAGIESPTLLESTVIMGVLALGVVVPQGPGFFGAFQISLYCGMVLFYPLSQVTGPGSVFVFWIYVVQISLTLLMAAGALALEGLSPAEALSVENPT